MFVYLSFLLVATFYKWDYWVKWYTNLMYYIHICRDMGFLGSSAGKESACNAGDLSSIPGSGRFPGEGIGYPLQYSWASLMTQMVKNLPAMWETWIRSLVWERSPGRGHSNPFQYSCLENPHRHRSLAVYGVTESDMTEQQSIAQYWSTPDNINFWDKLGATFYHILQVIMGNS